MTTGEPKDELVGKQVGEYLIVRLLGEGMYGKVYLGQHTIVKNHKVAIKVSRPENFNPTPFLQEAEIITSLDDHANIVKFLGYGVQGAIAFLVMQLALGDNLRKRYPKGTCLDLNTVAFYATQIAQALQHAHDHGIFHRDVRPENLLLLQATDKHILLSDFGIATFSRESSPQGPPSLDTGPAAYRAPECFTTGPIPASDQYALAVVVYEWLCGKLPFEGTHDELRDQHSRHKQPPSLHELVPTIPLAVEQVVRRALANDHTKRFGSVLGFAQALEMAALSEHQAPPSDKRSRREALRFIRAAAMIAIVVGSSTAVVATEGKQILEFLFHPAPGPQSNLTTIGSTLYTYQQHLDKVWVAIWAPNNQDIASGAYGGEIRIWKAISGNTLLHYRGHTARVTDLAWSPDGKTLASSSLDGRTQLLDILTNRHIPMPAQGADMLAVAWSPNGQVIAWNVEDIAQIDNDIMKCKAGCPDVDLMLPDHGDPDGHTEWITSLAFSPNSKFLASGSNDTTVRVWYLDAKKSITLYKGHEGYVLSVTWSPDGTRIASASDDKTVQVWNAFDGTLLLTYQGHSDSVQSVAWSPDGKSIASGSADMTVHLWDSTNGHLIYTYRGHTAGVNSVAWSPDGKLIVSASDDQTVQVWRAVTIHLSNT